MLAAASAFLFCTWYPLLVLAQAKTFPNECVACVAHNKSWCPTYLPTYNTDGQCVEENVPCAFGTVTTCTKCPEQRASEELRKRCAAKTCEECAIKSGEVWKVSCENNAQKHFLISIHFSFCFSMAMVQSGVH